MNSKVFERIVDTRDELLARILGAAVRTKELEDQLRRTTRDLYTRVSKPIEEFWNICCELQQICHLNIKLIKIKLRIKSN